MADVLIHGVTGGREAAIGEAMSASPEVSRVEFDGGNLEAGLEMFRGSAVKPFVIIGPEQPLVEGVADALRDEGYTVFGVGGEAAQYEASKSRTIKMARNAGIIHPKTQIAEGESMAQTAQEVVDLRQPTEYVIKADGLAGGKGVVLPDSVEEAQATIDGMISGELFGGAGAEIINFSERKTGPEVSALTIVGSGKDNFLILPLSQDHKRLLDDDKGPNTGGMGAYSPVPPNIVNEAQYASIEAKVRRILEGIESEGVEYSRGALYPGLMMSNDLRGELTNESDLIEINVRLGDPETQPVFALLRHAGVDIYRLLRSAAEGELEIPNVDMRNIGGAAVSICMAAEGYPNAPRKGDEIFGLDRSYRGVSVQLAGARREGDQVFTNGGRVLYVTGAGENIDQAAERAYWAIGTHSIYFAGEQHRSDIGWQARGIKK